MTKNQKLYVLWLNIFMWLTIASVGYLVIMNDHSEKREPFEFVPVAPSTK